MGAETQRGHSISESGDNASRNTSRTRDRSRSRECPFQIGDVVNARNNNSEPWNCGMITQVAPCVLVQLLADSSSKASPFSQIAPAASRKFATKMDLCVYKQVSDVGTTSKSISKLAFGTEIEVVTFQSDFARIISPVHGWIQAKHEGRKQICKPEKLETTAPTASDVVAVSTPAPLIETPVVVVSTAAPLIETPAEEIEISPKEVSVAAPEVKNNAKVGNGLHINDIVNVRNSDSESWLVGIVAELTPFVKVYVAGVEEPTIFHQIAPPAKRKFVLKADTDVHAEDENKILIRLPKNTEIEVVEIVEDWALIISPSRGWIRVRVNGEKLMSRVGRQTSRKQNTEPKNNTNCVTLKINVDSSTSADDLAMLCQTQTGILPLNIEVHATNRDDLLFAFLTFETHQDANVVHLKGLSHHSGKTLITEWKL